MSILTKKIGIIGGGQLGKMMILEAKRLGFYVITLDPEQNCPSCSISDELIVAAFDDEEAIFELAEKVDVITYEYEHIGVTALEKVEKEGPAVYPSVASLKVIKDKLAQKTALQEQQVPVPEFVKVETVEDIYAVGERFQYPMMLKTTKGGYDGKGVALIHSYDNVVTAYESLGGGSKELMVEAFVPFEMEISIIACRGIDGARKIYPVAENIHQNSILDTTMVPARISKKQMEVAQKIADQVMEVFAGVGTFCVEMFVVGNEIYVNEVAPRPHNSGHYTIEGTWTNQFENHIRAIVGLPLGDVSLITPTVMINLLGEIQDGRAEVLGVEEAYHQGQHLKVHIYGKKNVKVDRKMGHFTTVGDTLKEALERAEATRGLVRVVGVDHFVD